MRTSLFSIALAGLVVIAIGLVGGEGGFSSTASEKCVLCHQGIEAIHPFEIECTLCHRGDGEAVGKEEAHAGLLPNPSDLRVVDRTCGLCHEEWVEVVRKSLHATSAGIISGARYQWGAQETKNALYGVLPVEDKDGQVPKEAGAVAELAQIPSFQQSGNHVDDYLRKDCLRCHLWDEGIQRPGDYRSSGCAACHVLYAEDGLSRSGDLSIRKDEPGHPIKHQITAKIPAQQCTTCHNRGDRIGVSFVGLMESDGYGTPFTEGGEKQPLLHGKQYNHLLPDLHYERGMTCIDCHTAQEVMGDGNIYSKKEQAVEIECGDCHGTAEAYATLKTQRGTALRNLETRNREVILTAKLSGSKHTVPQLRDLAERGHLPVAMSIPAHMEKLECYACHDVWAPQCYGCHAKRDDRREGWDWIDKARTEGHWEEERSYVRWESPVLGINSKGKVSPFIPGCQVLFTWVDKDGQVRTHNQVFTTAAGLPGIAQNPLRPHTTRKEARECQDCHASRKALGLGSGIYDPKANGLPIDFEWERIVNEDGEQIQETSHYVARPFNKEELERINRVGVCLACHSEMDSAVWQGLLERHGPAPDDRAHQRIIRDILRGSAP